MPFDGPPEKPYAFAPLPESLARDKASGHHSYREDLMTGALECALALLRPVQVASGIVSFVRGERSGEQLAALHASVTRGGRRVYVIPGSSLKGAVRSVAEAVSRSCFSVADKSVDRLLPGSLKRCRQVQALCPACRLFGMTAGRRENYLGSVHMADVPLPPGGRVALVYTPLLWTPAPGRRGLPPRYLQNSRVRGRKFYFHGKTATGPDARIALAAGQTLHTTIYFESLSPALLGVLFTALGQHPRFPFLLKLGAAKPVGLGSVQVQVTAAELRSTPAQRGRLGGAASRREGEALETWIAECCQKAEDENLLNLAGLEQVATILGREGLDSRQLPSDPY